MPMIKQKLLVCVLFVLVAIGKASGQDIIFYKNGNNDTVKIVERDTETISFKRYKRLNGPLYVVLKSALLFIKFEDGKIEVLDSTGSNGNKKPKPYLLPMGRNIITANIFSMILGNVQLGYESLRNEGRIGYKVSFLGSILSEDTDVSMQLLGFDVNFYPAAQKWVTYFYGPAIRYGYVDYHENGIDPARPFVSILFNNGFVFNAGNSFYIGTQIGLGPGIYKSNVFPYGYLTLNLGVRF